MISVLIDPASFPSREVPQARYMPAGQADFTRRMALLKKNARKSNDLRAS
jgi:hypothetical protein